MRIQKRARRLMQPEQEGTESALPAPPPAPPEESPTRGVSLWRRAIPTAEGAVWLFLAVFFISLRAFNLVTLVGSFMLGMLLLNWLRVLWRGNLWGLRIKRSVQRGVYAGETAQMRLEIKNDSKKAQPGLSVSERGSCHFRRWTMPEIGAGKAEALQYAVAMPRRGRCWFGPVEIVSGYPFGLFRSWVRFEKLGEALVLPKLGTVHRGRLRRLLHSPAHPTSIPERHLHRRSAVPADFYGVRDFRPGDSPRWIHWRTTARMGIPMVREFEETPLDHLIVVLEAWLPRPARELYGRWSALRGHHQEELAALGQAGARGAGMLRGKEEAYQKEAAELRRPLDLLEKAISLAATLCHSWQASGAQMVLAIADGEARVPGRISGNRGVLFHLESLALVEGSPNPDLDGVVRQLGGMDLPDGPILALSARASPLAERLHSALRRPVTPLNVADAGVFDYFETEAKAVLL